MENNKKKKKGQRSVEHFNHFRCHVCNKWWGIGDPPSERNIWFCPWCGKEQEFEES